MTQSLSGLNTRVFVGAYGYFGATTHPANYAVELNVPNGNGYVDNVLSLQNSSQDPVTGAVGNAAITFRDSVLNYERAAVGYSRVNTGTATGYFANSLYAEYGNIGPPADPDDTDFRFINTHAALATNFPGTSYTALLLKASDGSASFFDHSAGLLFKVTETQINAYKTLALGTTQTIKLSSPAAGVALITDASGTDINRICGGGTSASYPSWQRSGTGWNARLADNSGYTGVVAANFRPPNGTIISDNGDGQLQFTTSAGAIPTGLSFGGWNVANVQLRPDGAGGVTVRKGDNSADGGFKAGASTFSGAAVFQSTLKLASYTVGTLPSASSSGAGANAYVTDSNQTLAAGLGSTVASGGSNKVPVGSDGTNWIIGG